MAVMSMIICGVEAVSIVNTFGRGVILNSLSFTMRGVLNSLSYLTEYDQPKVKEVVSKIKNIDLEHKIKLIQTLINELKLLEDHYNSKTIDFALYSLEEQLKLISEELDTFKDAIDNHTQKYFSGWKNLSQGSTMVSSLTKKKRILDSRYNELIDLLGLNDLLSAEKKQVTEVKENRLALLDKQTPSTNQKLLTNSSNEQVFCKMPTYSYKSYIPKIFS